MKKQKPKAVAPACKHLRIVTISPLSSRKDLYVCMVCNRKLDERFAAVKALVGKK